MATIRTLAFAAPDGSAWGAAWLPGDGTAAALAYRVKGDTGMVEAELRAPGDGEPWQVEGGGISLVFTPSGAGGHGGSADRAVDSVDQLCSVDGRLVLDEGHHEITATGWRSTLEGDFDLAGIDSFRQTFACFEPLHGLSLVALRPRKARGHDDDLVAASLLEPEPVPPVADPRLSTTYDAAGLPTRVGLELWLEPEGSDEQGGDDSEHQIPRRAAGESIGSGLHWKLADFTLRAALLRWHSRGDDGSGVYLLGRRR